MVAVNRLHTLSPRGIRKGNRQKPVIIRTDVLWLTAVKNLNQGQIQKVQLLSVSSLSNGLRFGFVFRFFLYLQEHFNGVLFPGEMIFQHCIQSFDLSIFVGTCLT